MRVQDGLEAACCEASNAVQSTQGIGLRRGVPIYLCKVELPTGRGGQGSAVRGRPRVVEDVALEPERLREMEDGRGQDHMRRAQGRQGGAPRENGCDVAVGPAGAGGHRGKGTSSHLSRSCGFAVQGDRLRGLGEECPSVDGKLFRKVHRNCWRSCCSSSL